MLQYCDLAELLNLLNLFVLSHSPTPRFCFCFCGPPAMLVGPLSFHLSRCLDVCTRQHQKVNLSSLMRTRWLIFVKLTMWVVGVTSTTHVVCRHRMRIFDTLFAYLFWLGNKKNVKYPEFCTFVKLGIHWWNLVCEKWWAQVLPMWSVVTECAYSIPHLHICSDWLITNKSSIQRPVWATLMKLDM